ncbi:unnamed protein product, partial [Symbiodinium sp. KB8]
IKSCIASGLPARWPDITRVFSHHAAPPRGSYLMGRGQKWQSQDSWSPRSWQLWRGSWQHNKGDQKGRIPKATAAFPAYDAERGKAGPKGNQKGSWGPRDQDADDGGGLTSILQASLNTTRKAEQRVQHLAAAADQRAELWAIYEKDIAAAYRKEHARFLRDMARLKEDHQKAVAAQAGARTDLLRVFYSGGVAPEPANTVNVESLMQSWRSPPEEQDFQSIIQRAAQAAEEARHARDIAQGRPDLPAAPATPTFGVPPPGLGLAPGAHPPGLEAGMTGPGEGAIGEDATMEYSSYTARDPYMTSPSSTHAVPGHPSPSQHYKAPDGLSCVGQDETTYTRTCFARGHCGPFYCSQQFSSSGGNQSPDGGFCRLGEEEALADPCRLGRGAYAMTSPESEYDWIGAPGEPDGAPPKIKAFDEEIQPSVLQSYIDVVLDSTPGADPLTYKCLCTNGVQVSLPRALLQNLAGFSGVSFEEPGQAAQQGFEVQEVTQDPPLQRQGPVVQGAVPAIGEDPLPPNIVQCLVFTPCFVPDILHVSLSIPCSVEWALEIFEQNRDDSQARCFDRLLPATPQPDRRYAICVAEPSWAVHGVTILCNGSAALRGIYAVFVPHRLNKGSLLRALGFDPEVAWDVFVHGLLRPIPDDVWVDLRSGFTVSVVPGGSGAPPAWDLADMLQEDSGWDPDTDVPEAHEDAAIKFLVLTEGSPIVLRLEGDGNASVKARLAPLLGCQLHQLTAKTTSPRILDLMYLGSAMHAVIVGRTALQTIPYPPARAPERRRILVLDCRAVLQCFRWILCDGLSIDIHDIAALFADHCPSTHLVGVKGAEVRHDLVHFEHGQVIQIEYVTDPDPTFLTEEEDSGEGGENHSPNSQSPLEDPSEDRTAENPCSDTSSVGSGRSRSARRSHSTPGTKQDSVPTACHSSHDWLDLRQTGDRDVGPRHPAAACADVDLCKGGALAHIQRHNLISAVGHTPMAFGPGINLRCMREPVSATFGQQSRLASLRRATRQLGHEWLYLPNEGPLDLLTEDSEREASSEAVSDTLAVWFVVATPGYVREFIEVALLLPATIPEALGCVQQERDHEPASLFPQLVPVRPQPCPGSGFVLANPAWDANRRTICLNTRALDGRIFAAVAPAYVSRSQLLVLACIPFNLGWDVLTGLDQLPIADEAWIHTSPGDLFTFVPPGFRPDQLFDLGQALMHVTAWSATCTVPRSPHQNAYCLIFGSDNTLHLYDEAFPMTYREQISRSIGVASSHIRIVPSKPAIVDCAIDGIICRTVVVICDAGRPDGPGPVAVVLDARPLGLGFFGLELSNGWDPSTATDALAFTPPEGWRLKLSANVSLQRGTTLRAGQVVVVEVTALPTSSALQAPALCDILPPATGDQDGHGATQVGAGIEGDPPAASHSGSVHGVDAGVPSAQVASGCTGADPATELAPDVVTSPDPAAGTVAAEDFRDRIFLVLGQNYTPELITVRLSTAIHEGDALQLVGNARRPSDSSRLPRLGWVSPQPSSSYAILIAYPEFVFSGVLCAFDCRAVNGHVFVLHIGCVADKQGLLNAAGLSDRNDIAVFVGRQPWPLPHNIRIDLTDGDLLAFIPESDARDPVCDVSHILRGPEASPDHIDFPRTVVEAAWVLHEGGGFQFEVSPDRRSFVRRDLAEIVQAPAHQLVIRPAKPAIVDHAVRGAPSRNVLATCRCRGSHYNEPRDVIVILDVRPILLTFTWWFCPQGTLALSEVQSRFGDRCPPGFCIGLLTFDGFFVDAGARITVQDGEHVTVVFTEEEGDTADETSDQDDDELRRAGTMQDADDTTQEAPGTGQDFPEGRGFQILSDCQAAISIANGVVCRWAKGDDTLPSPLGQAIGEGRHHGGASSDDLVAPFIPEEIDIGLALLWKGLLFDRAGAVKGHFGVEVWFRQGHKISLLADGRGIEDATGKLCATPEDAIARWREYFSALEAIHRAYRPCIQRHFETVAHPLQLGGRRGGSVLFGSFAMRTFMRWRAAQGLSSAVIFADVSSAYYCTARELAARLPAEEPTSHEGNAHNRNSSEPDDLSVDKQIAQPSAMLQTGAEPWLRAVTATINSNTWMVLQGDSVPIATRRGTRPGSAWADLTFGIIIGRILKLRNACRPPSQSQVCSPAVPWDHHRDWRPVEHPVVSLRLEDLVWADDIAECLAVGQADEIARSVALETGVLADAFDSHQFQLAFGPRKTAAIVSPRGPGARGASRTLFGGRAELKVMREHQGVSTLPLVDHYKHLGVLQSREGGIKPEIKQRCAAAWSAFREGRTRLFGCKRISVQRRGALLQTLVMSRLCFGCGAWPPLRTGEYQLFAGAVFALYRATLGLRHDSDQHLSVATICALLNLPDYDTILKVEQLRFLKQLVLNAPDIVWALARQDVPFINNFRSALAWLYDRVKATSTLPDPLADWQPWLDMLQDRPSLYRGLVQRARGLELCRISCTAALQALYRALIIHGQGRDIEDPCDDKPFVEACLICRKAFTSRSAWACHSSKLHGYRITASLLVGSNGRKTCAGCGKCYANPARLRRHLLHATDCRKNWGAFNTAEGQEPTLHDHEPPLQLDGAAASGQGVEDPASYSPGLLQALDALQSPEPQEVWDLVVDFVEPIAVLRSTLEIWKTRPGASDQVVDAADEVTLMLDPELCCDTFHRTKSSPPITACCPELPGPLSLVFPFILTGQQAVFSLDPPPCPSFSYPFIGGAPLASAKRQTAFVEGACEIVGHFVEQSLNTRVLLRASQACLRSLEPVPTWLLSVGFHAFDGGISSPED